MTPQLTNEMTASLLILWISTVLAMGTLISLAAVSCLKRRQAAANPLPSSWPPGADVFDPGFFERPCSWMAVKGGNLKAVQTALDLHNPSPCSWAEGLARLEEHKLFLSPPVQGWILIFGQALPDPVEDIDDAYRFILKLSRALGQVQFFSANRPVNYHAWVHADHGRVLRAFAWAGQTLWNQGKITQAEKDLGLITVGYGEESSSVSSADSFRANSEKLACLAARWSLDPTSLDQRVFSKAPGIAGDLIHTKSL